MKTDNIDTRSVLLTIKEFITQCNVYMKQSEHPNILLLRDIGVYITKIFSIFGAIASTQETIGFPIDNETNTNVCSSILIKSNQFKIHVFNVRLKIR